MTLTTKKLSFQEYLVYDDRSDTRFELVDGELVAMSLGTGKHGGIMHFLEQCFNGEITQMQTPWIALKAIVGVRSPRGTRWDTVRIPDVTVLPLEQWQSLQEREAVIDLHEPPPLLVVEVVSESTTTVDRRTKRGEYGVLDIPEYWIVDPFLEIVTICELVEGLYDGIEFHRGDGIRSPTFPNLHLTVEQILNGKR